MDPEAMWERLREDYMENLSANISFRKDKPQEKTFAAF